MELSHPSHILTRDPVRERAPGEEIGDEDRLLGVDELGRLRHEVDSGEDDHVGLDIERHLGQEQRVAGDVRRQVVDVRRHVVVSRHDRVALGLEPVDVVDHGLERRDLLLGQDVGGTGDLDGGHGLPRQM